MMPLLALGGAVLIGVILLEVFAELIHPSAKSALGDWLGRLLFRVLRGTPRRLPLAGPLTFVLVVGAWVAGLVLGFALVYLGFFPGGFQTSTGQTPSSSARMLITLYFSFQTLITLGYGDLVPVSPWARFTAAGEALVGFGLLTASVSEIVLLYPALARMRVLAHTVAHFVEAEQRSGIQLAASGSETVLAGLAPEVAHARVDLLHFPIIYYFAASDPRASVARWTGELERFAREGSSAECTPPVRLAAEALSSALNDYAAVLAQRFVRVSDSDRSAVFRAFAADHAIHLDRRD